MLNKQFNTRTQQWEDVPEATRRALASARSAAPVADPAAGSCAGCGGEKFEAKTPQQMEAVLRDHVS